MPQCAGSGSITPTFVFAVETLSQQLSHENVNRTEASRHHVGYEVHALPTVFMEVEDSRQLSSLSFNILSDYWVMSSLPVVKHLQRSITLFTHLSSEGWLGPLLRSFVVPKNVQNKSWLEELWSITKSNKNPFSQNQRSVKIEVNKFWVEPGTPEKYVKLHPFIESRYRIWIYTIWTWWRGFPRPHGSQVNSGSEVGKWSLGHCLRRNLTLPDFCCCWRASKVN